MDNERTIECTDLAGNQVTIRLFIDDRGVAILLPEGATAKMTRQQIQEFRDALRDLVIEKAQQ